jgi:hypothetical protein
MSFSIMILHCIDRMKKSKNKISRRDVLKGAAHAGLAATLLPLSGFSSTETQKSGLIAAENKKPGTTDWQLTFIKSEQFRSKLIEGYCSKTSVRSGESLDIFLNAASQTDISIDIYRMGYYGGKGGRFVKKLGPFPVSPQVVPPIAENRLRQCEWEKSATSLKIPQDWLSGVYLGKLSCSTHRYESYIIFIVRDDRKADVMFQTSDNTWQAYNKWPDTFSLYDSDPPQQSLSGRTWVSYNRPYAQISPGSRPAFVTGVR